MFTRPEPRSTFGGLVRALLADVPRGRVMLEALVAGERNPNVLADLAKARLRGKMPQLIEALTGNFTDHHAYLCHTMLSNIDRITHQIDQLTARIEAELAEFAGDAVERLDEITGIGPRAAQVIIAEIGLDMSRFPPRHTWPPGPGWRL